MKILFVTYDFPYPTNSGGKTRAYNLIKQKDSDVELYLFSFIRKSFDKKNKEALEKIGVKNIFTVERSRFDSLSGLLKLANPTRSIFHKLYFRNDVAQKLLQIVKKEKIDIVHFESYYTGFYLGKELSEMGVKQIFGTENIEANVYESYIRTNVPSVMKPLYFYENKKIRKEEERMTQIGDINLAVTPSEKKYIEHITQKKVEVIPNGVDLKTFTYKPKKPDGTVRLLFIGNFTYHPNIDAANFFYKNIYSQLDHSKYEFRIIGKNVAKLSFVNNKSIHASEFVKDILSEYHGADIFVSPVRIGGGTNFKILESMATGLPVIALPHRLSDLDVTSGKELLIAESSDEFIALIHELSTDMSLRTHISEAARAFIEKHYSWDVIGEKMNSVWRSLV